jgi:hypothetical protein
MKTLPHPATAQPYRCLDDRRDYAVLEFPLPGNPATAARLVAIYDEVRDPRLLSVIVAIRYRSPPMLAIIPALFKHHAELTFWCTDAAQADAARKAVQGAADACLIPGDKWIVLPPRVVTTRGGFVDRDALSPDDPLRTTARHIALGLVRS